MILNEGRKRNVFLETVGEIFPVLWFTIYHLGKALRYLCRAPIRAIKCKFGYYKSPFYKLTGMKKEDFYGGSSWDIGNDQRYLVCNTIGKLPLEAISVDNPRNQDSKLMENIPRFGSCHYYWANKKRILKEKYGIDWKSPAELNPHICFD